MAGQGARQRNQPPTEMPMLGSLWIGSIGGPWWGGSDHPHADGPLHRNTMTPTSSRCTCLDDMEGGTMIPSPLGRGFPSRHGWYLSF